MTITQAYAQYRIMPCLELHQLRVAAVAEYIFQHAQFKANRNQVVTALLLHDMGNIIKFDLDRFPEFLEPQGKKYWRKVMDEYIERYGNEEQLATMSIAQELGVSRGVLNLIDAIGFGRTEAIAKSKSYNGKVCAYSDIRVAPHGVVSLDDRIKDLHERYHDRYPSKSDRDFRQKCESQARIIESQIFRHTQLQATDITDRAVSGTINRLRNFNIG